MFSEYNGRLNYLYNLNYFFFLYLLLLPQPYSWFPSVLNALMIQLSFSFYSWSGLIPFQTMHLNAIRVIFPCYSSDAKAPHNQHDQVLSRRKKGGWGQGHRKQRQGQERGKGKKTLSISSAAPLRRPTIQTLQSNFQFSDITVSLSFASHFAYNTPLFTHQAMWKHLPWTTKNYREVEIKEN